MLWRTHQPPDRRRAIPPSRLGPLVPRGDCHSRAPCLGTALVYTGPVTRLGTWLRRALQKLQGLALYRRLAGSLRPRIEIREADQEDMQQVHAWLAPGSGRRRTPQNPNATDFVAKRRNRVVGYVQLVRFAEGTEHYPGYWGYSIAVRPRYRGLGIGVLLTQAITERARAEGATELLVFVREDNPQSLGLCYKLGFEPKMNPALAEQMERKQRAQGYREVALSRSLIEDRPRRGPDGST